LLFATDALIERAIATHGADSARRFILGIAELQKDRGTLAVVPDNFPQVVQLATLERFAGNRALADDLARRILDFVDHGGDVGFPGDEEWVRAEAAALLGRNDEALTHLEKLMSSGRRVGWWQLLERSPTFAGLHEIPRFRAIAAETRVWLQSQIALLGQMRLRGEVPPRSAPALPGGC
jgi:hypothetical protein